MTTGNNGNNRPQTPVDDGISSARNRLKHRGRPQIATPSPLVPSSPLLPPGTSAAPASEEVLLRLVALESLVGRLAASHDQQAATLAHFRATGSWPSDSVVVAADPGDADPDPPDAPTEPDISDPEAPAPADPTPAAPDDPVETVEISDKPST